MRLTIVTHGSEGDTRPLAALCRGLMDRGHELLLFADESTLTLPRKLGVPTQALAGDIKATLPIGDPKREIRISDVLRTANAVKAEIAAHSAAWLKSVGEHARDSQVIVFSSLAAGIGRVLRDEFAKPGVGIFFQPLTPTTEFSSPMLPPLNLPGWARRATFKVSLSQMWSTCGRAAENARARACSDIAGHAATWTTRSCTGSRANSCPGLATGLRSIICADIYRCPRSIISRQRSWSISSRPANLRSMQASAVPRDSFGSRRWEH